jgi:hypothetical protein
MPVGTGAGVSTRPIESRRRKQTAWAVFTSPIPPPFTNSTACRMPVMLRLCTPIWTIRPSRRAHSVMIRPSLTLWLQGFST